MVPQLPSGAKTIIKRLEDAGFDAHIVGGCVRDFLLSKTPFDFDITTSALPDEMKSVFSDMRTVETGIKHGTLTVLADGEAYEVTTYRVDGEYENHRKPKSVTFSRSLSEDLSRRDFTMNAICYSERDGFIDEFSGIPDIEKRIIRAVGEPGLRFEEDALRILRALRFSSQLGFLIEAETEKALFEKAHLLLSVSAERIYSEWHKLIGGKYAYDVIERYGEIISRFLTPLPIKLPRRDLFDGAEGEIRQLSIFAISADESVSAFSDFCDRMKTDAKTKRGGALALSNIDIPISSKADVRLAMIRLGEKTVRDILRLRETLSMGCGEGEDTVDEILRSDYPLSLSLLKVGGEDMKQLGLSGRDIGSVLWELLLMTARDEVKNEREALMRAAEKIKNGI